MGTIFIRIIVAIVVLCPVGLLAQIQLTPVVYNNLSSEGSQATQMLLVRLQEAINKQGVASTVEYSRFVLAANINAEEKEILATIPAQIAYTINVSLAIGDGLAGKVFDSQSFLVKGVGTTEDRAQSNALRNIKFNKQQITQLVSQGQQKILDYYEKNASSLIDKAKNLSAQGKYEEALQELSLIPHECSAYPQASASSAEIYNKMIDVNAAKFLLMAEGLWASNPNPSNGMVIMGLLSQINPKSGSYSKAQALIKKVEVRYMQLERQKIDLEKARINAIKAVLVEQARNKPKIVYNVRGFW